MALERKRKQDELEVEEEEDVKPEVDKAETIEELQKRLRYQEVSPLIGSDRCSL